MGWVGSLGLLVLLASEFLLIWFFYFLFSLASFFLTACLQVLVGAAGLLLGCCWGLLGAAGGWCWWLLGCCWGLLGAGGGCCWWLLGAAGGCCWAAAGLLLGIAGGWWLLLVAACCCWGIYIYKDIYIYIYVFENIYVYMNVAAVAYKFNE